MAPSSSVAWERLRIDWPQRRECGVEAALIPAMADPWLIVRAAQGDQYARTELYLRYVEDIYRYCRTRLPTKEEAEDATSRVIMQMLTSIDKCRDRTRFRAWLFTIAHNVVIDIYRERRRQSDKPLDGQVDLPDPRADDHLLDVERKADLETVVAFLPRLSADQREIVELRMAGLTGTEIAKVLGREPGAVRMAQTRAVAKLREFLCPKPSEGKG